MSTRLPRIPEYWSEHKIKGQLARARQYVNSETGHVKEFYERLVSEYEAELERRKQRVTT